MKVLYIALMCCAIFYFGTMAGSYIQVRMDVHNNVCRAKP